MPRPTEGPQAILVEVETRRWTVEQLTADLVGLGVKTGDLVMVHASLRAVGPTDGGADGVIDAPLPMRLEATVFARFGGLWATILVLVSVIFCALVRGRQR